MANKTPFEVRLDVLKMAQNMLDRETELNQEKFNTKYDYFKSTYPAGPMLDLDIFIDSNIPKMYESSDVLKRANELYAFVSNRLTEK
jgi:hypothetical protein